MSKSQPRQQHQDAVSAERTSLTHVAAKFKFTALRDYLLEPEANYKWTKMPNFKLNAKEALDLASYLYQASAVKALPTSQGDATIGQTLYNQNYCANCHSPAQQPKVAIQNFNVGCLSRNTHIDLHMQNRQKWQMSAFLQQEMMTFSRVATHEFAERQINQLQCSSCHVRDDKPSSWASNVSSVQDLKITHKDKGHLDQTRPPLTYTGEKLTPETIGDYLAGDLRYQTRDWLLAKMPAFPARAELLSAGMALQHGQYAQQENLAVNLQLIPEGEKLVSAMGGFSCVICHDIGAQKATAAFEVQGVNLKYSAKRLTPDYFLRWMLDPIHIDPTTKMPKYFDDQEKSAMPVFDHNASKQIEAIHQYLYSIE
ncbi:hypothetical protein RS130_16880 [Paraglaciecola aquimarina]|uniref:Cytochrome c domain-containing protein n=1 Tax=Paraglaciecola aquimarina TaxID=1235557 RepID=A0ABU3SZC1_9ALTE|nr:hypothetical protein [Paraglaciecola aquimarina]MDU0355357.1 hypothetical protein [Paraglaciecola aquimarina]